MASSTVFDISNKALKLDTAEDISKHIEPLTKSTSFTEIHFNGNTIGIGAAEHFATVLKTQKALRLVQFADIFTGRLLSEIPAALEALLSALLELPRLHTVNLSDNAFGLNLVAPLVKFLRGHTPLQHLVLNNNGMGPIAGAQIADALAELAAKKAEARKAAGGNEKDIPDLESIVCGRNRLENGSMEAWARAYTALGTVKSIRMTQNGIRPEGIVTLLGDGLANCKGLEVCDLQDNTFTAVGSKTLAHVLQSWENLRELGLGDCYATARGFNVVVGMMAQGSNKKVQTLRLQYNEINGNGLTGLLSAVERGGLPELRRVELNGNKFQEDDERLEKLKDILNERREAAGVEDEDDENWGIDELDELEEDSDEEEEEEDEDEEAAEETKVKAEKDLEETDRAENEPVAQEKDVDVDALADSMAKKLNV